jgi:hypothetical protein
MGHLQLSVYPFSKEYEEQKDIKVFLGMSSLMEERRGFLCPHHEVMQEERTYSFTHSYLQH